MQRGLTSVMELHTEFSLSTDRSCSTHLWLVNGVRDLVNELSGLVLYSTELFLFFISVLDPYPVIGNENRGRVFL